MAAMDRKSIRNRTWKTLLLAAFFFVLAAVPCRAGTLPDVYAQIIGPSANGWATSPAGDWKYYANGVMQRGWQNIGEYWYYFDISGTMQTGWKEIDGAQYYLSEASVAGHPKGSLYVNGQTPDGAWVDGNGAKTAKANPYGHTCVEVDITNQTVYVYQGMDLVLSSPCVTGYRGVHDTAAGDWQISYKETDTYLKGPTWNSHVDYWMPFHGGQGLHDANWRGTSHENFGGQIYTYSGSHGCVNLPHDAAERLYAIAYVGMPVHVHY